MKQLYILPILITALLIQSASVKGQGSFDIVDPGPQLKNEVITFTLTNVTDGTGALNGDYIVEVNRTSPLPFYRLAQRGVDVVFEKGEAQVTTLRGSNLSGIHTIQIEIFDEDQTIEITNTIDILIADVLWKGESTDWHLGDNWSSGTIPGDAVYIGIPSSSNDPLISTNNVTVDKVFVDKNAKLTVSLARQLNVKAGGELTISEGSEVIINNSSKLTNDGVVNILNNGRLTIGPEGSWTANGNVTNNAGTEGIIIASNASGTGSVKINNGQYINATVQRYMTGKQWHVISSPVTNQGLPSFLQENNNISYSSVNNYYAMTHYTESKGSGSGGWAPYYTSSTSGSMGIARGYLAGINNDSQIEFKGQLTHLEHGRTITRAANGWNAIGNPYPTAIGVTSSASSKEKFLIENSAAFDPSFIAIYIYDPSTNDYIVINSVPTLEDYIQPGQGFLVKAAVGGGDVRFTPGMRAHINDGTFYKKSAITPWPSIQLKVSGNNKEAVTVITFNSNMTRGLDPGYDAGKFGGDPDFRLFTRLAESDIEVDFALQALPDYGFHDMVIPIGFDFSGSGEIVFSAENLTLPLGAHAILEDRALGKFTNLETDNYVVKLDGDIKGPGRFYLHTDIQVTSTENVHRNVVPAVEFYSYGKEIFINGRIDGIAYASIYDILGRKIKTVLLQDADRNSFTVENLESGIYILSINGKELNLSGRVFIK
jgi:hypothetical protein